MDQTVPLPCSRCDYDLRAQPRDGVCPECGASVVEAVKVAHLSRRPIWRDSDPRWRRRMLSGAWILVLVPLLNVLSALGWDSLVRPPTFFQAMGAISLGQTFLPWIYVPLMFCIGVVLLFSKERHRRPERFDWTKRWGVVASYGVLIVGFCELAFTPALVLVGIAAMFMGMPLQYQPGLTTAIQRAADVMLRHGPHPSLRMHFATSLFSSAAVLLAVVPLYQALRSAGRQAGAVVLVIPLALAAALQILQSGTELLSMSRNPLETIHHIFYFYPPALTDGFVFLRTSASQWYDVGRDFLIEAAKWLDCLTIAVCLSLAQIGAMRRRATAPADARG